MKLLLDTHTWIWALHSSEKLGRAVRRQLENPGNELYLSPISIWEARHLERCKRLRIKQSFPEWLDQVFSRIPLLEAPFNFAVAVEASRIELNCRRRTLATSSWLRPRRFSASSL